MPNHRGRYPRPYLEIEYERQALTQEDVCCRYVPVVVRLCNVPEGVMLTVLFERVRKKDQDGRDLNDYEVHPHDIWKQRVRKDFPGYHEYHLQLLARPHREETGLIHIKIESPSYSLLTEACYRLDSREAEPVCSDMHDGSFRGVRLVPFLRTPEARDALLGQYPASAPREGHPDPQLAALGTAQAPADASSLRNWWLVEH